MTDGSGSPARAAALPFWIAVLASLGWLAGAPLLIGAGWSLEAYRAMIFEQAAGLWLPVLAAFAVAAAAALVHARPAAEEESGPDLATALSELDLAAARVRALREALAGDVARLAETADALAARLGTAREALAGTEQAARDVSAVSGAFAEAAAGAAAAAEAARAALEAARTDAASSAETTGALLARLREAQAQLSEKAAEAAARLEEAIAAAARRAAEAAELVGAQGRAAEAAAEAALARTGEAAARLGETLEAQSRELAGRVAEAHEVLARLGGEAAERLAARLEALARAAAETEERLARQAATTDAIGASAERAFQLLDARLKHSATLSASTLEALAARVQAVHDRIDALGAPVGRVTEALAALEAGATALDQRAQELAACLAGALPAGLQAATENSAGLRREVEALGAAVERAVAAAAALVQPVGESEAAFARAAARFAEEREAVRTAGEALVGELEEARRLIAEVEQATEATSLAAATRLVDAMTRVREVAQQTTGTLREMLAGVIGEARESLARAAGEAMTDSFARPIAEQARTATEAARAAAERTAASLAALASTIRMLEEQATVARADLTEVAQRELAAAAGFLTDRLAEASISIASALGRPMTDEDWASWRRGERTLFRRRAITLLDRADRERLRHLIGSNPDFAHAARAYTAGFEALLARFDRANAPGVAAALLDSDSGRLAAALTEALET